MPHDNDSPLLAYLVAQAPEAPQPQMTALNGPLNPPDSINNDPQTIEALDPPLVLHEDDRDFSPSQDSCPSQNDRRQHDDRP